MTHQFEVGKSEYIDQIMKRASAALSQTDQPLCVEFIGQFLDTLSVDDLSEWSIESISCAMLHFWRTIKIRKPKHANISIYNPSMKQSGWNSPYTVLEIITEDEPFLVDTVRMAVSRLGFASHQMMYMGGLRVLRKKSNQITHIYPRTGESSPEVLIEAVVLLQIDKSIDDTLLQALKDDLERAFEDNRAVVEDWASMRERVRASIDELEYAPDNLDPFEVEEAQLFLKWIEDHHFTFLGVKDYELKQEGKQMVLKDLPDTGLGVLRKSFAQSDKKYLAEMTPEAQALTLSSKILIMSKTNTLATVHRNTYTDYIGIKRFNHEGQVIGERRIIGLYTSAAYNTNPKHIPFLRHKVTLIMQKSMLNPRSHAGKVLLNILETLPRDDLIQGSEDEILEMSMGIFHLQERRRIRLFARMDVYRRFVSCLVYIPRDRFNTDLRKLMQSVLSETFETDNIMFSTYFSESILARIHFIIRLNPGDKKRYQFKSLEKKLIEAGRSWRDDLQVLIEKKYDDDDATALYCRYRDAFPTAYTARFTPKIALEDIQYLEAITDDEPLAMNLYDLPAEGHERYRLKLYQHDFTLVLSDVLPILECLGMRAISERPYFIQYPNGTTAWLNEFILEYSLSEEFDIKTFRDCFQEAFKRVWFKHSENDGFNRLVLASGLNWREVSMLRTYAKYFKQISYAFSQDYIEQALVRNAGIARKIVQLFETRFKPAAHVSTVREKKCLKIKKSIERDLDHVTNLDEDKILNLYIQAILATLRTNYYQVQPSGQPLSTIALKIDSKAISGMPKPYPMFEIFVYSPIFEGVHLRASKVARGGLRWSDRIEDFRTEILGLMKAQQVKNAVIVPSGAKGGFVIKRMPQCANREQKLALGVDCYRQFIRALLSVTDNYCDQGIIKPQHVVCYDEDDPYLVVAADKGTATFSDIANEISAQNQFWLGDAFASGGSVGYDHKKMGITAKGAFESVKRHFYEMGSDIMKSPFTVIGIGDMSGDVFGNGMLLSKHTMLVAAFNHMHIFVDPNPNPKSSFKERERLFNLERSTWEDYNPKYISKGGGVFSRLAKSIKVSKEMQSCFGLTQKEIEPNELIKVILKADIDLLWSAGVGTFVKAQSESHYDVGDRANDMIRVNGKDLGCRVIGEGGNLGLTQLARVEYALCGGRVYTDFIDNAAGVNCSDREVNIKILFNQVISAGKINEKKRNQQLASMTDEVSDLVLRDNRLQTRSISYLTTQATKASDLNNRYLNTLEQLGKLDRALEFLPDQKELGERKLQNIGFSSPEISVLVCYSKILIKDAILNSDVPDDPFLRSYLFSAFPQKIQSSYPDFIEQHPLKREIISTTLSNLIVNESGFNFVYRLLDETGAVAHEIMRAYMITREIFDLNQLFEQLEAMDGQMSAAHQNEILMSCIRLLRRTTRWFLKFKRGKLSIENMVKRYHPNVCNLKAALPDLLPNNQRHYYNQFLHHMTKLGLPKGMAKEIAANRSLFIAMDLVEIAELTQKSVEEVGQLYFYLGEFLELSWVRMQLVEHSVENRWEALSREGLRDDLDWQQRKLTTAVLNNNFDDWMHTHKSLIERWQEVVYSLKSNASLNYSMFFVAVKELIDLTETTIDDLMTEH